MTDWTPDGEAEVRDWASWDAEHQSTHTTAPVRSAYTKGSKMKKSEMREAVRAAEFRADQAEYGAEIRAKYSAEEMQAHLKAGKAMANPNGDPSYPVADLDDIKKAVKAVGRGSADHDAIRLHIIKGATALGAEALALIPDNWNSDGSLKAEGKSAPTNLGNGTDGSDGSYPCPVCGGKGQTKTGMTCVDCHGDGVIKSAKGAPRTGDGVAPDEAKSNAIYVDQFTAEITHSDRAIGHRAAPDTQEDRDELREVLRYVGDVAAELAAIEDDEARTAAESELSDELRAALVSYNDIERAVESALQEKLGDNDGDCDLWVNDAGDGWAVFRSYINPPGMGLFKVTFDCDTNTGAITFTSDPQPVAQVTTYQVIPQPSGNKTLVEAARSEGTPAAILIEMEELERRSRRNKR